ncbi:hypothetical protein HUK76_21685 [Citrobacter portucalensis]|uniref:hypothetical protein n=1 Tax=Citrobacter portucalensis TaxID=1639133 RepID=UPI00158115A6|nr:hypothetical protein [Citrobacter portucalensis]NUH56263.1 hypothetical protein [Citrobacter portucalensis]
MVISTIQNLAGEFSSLHQWGIVKESMGYALPAKSASTVEEITMVAGGLHNHYGDDPAL